MNCCSNFIHLFLLFSESEVVYRNRDGHVVKFNFKLNETELILSNKTFVSAPISLLSSVSLPQMVLCFNIGYFTFSKYEHYGSTFGVYM